VRRYYGHGQDCLFGFSDPWQEMAAQVVYRAVADMRNGSTGAKVFLTSDWGQQLMEWVGLDSARMGREKCRQTRG